MEGVGSRLGRASSRYGPSATATVFNGPVRKWKKKWVHVSPPSSTVSHHNSNSHSQSNGHANNTTNSRLLLCRWTPLSPADATSEEPPKRKFRYTPIVVLEEEQRKAAKQVDHEAKTDGTNQFTALHPSKNDELNNDTALKTETQDSNVSNLDLDLCLKGHNGDPDSVGRTKESQVKKGGPGGLWTTG
ncbi:hypothetical protein JCGZ_00952 [Jatropha curcas]|uniref:Uncharacterized protein n=1 Tax=Jatropha curcas TaxID=180498 RepID=A0A067L3X9_JATCU|nr:uncharacterized protein LOC105633020 [Jatropha curcas]KDP39195.1 hypothetical protein JCGZ_00952 [Jatropha curcas]